MVPSKKQRSFIQLSLTNLVTQKGMDLIKDRFIKPLVEQGPFDCFLHNCYSQDWKKELQLFLFQNPNVLNINSPDAIEIKTASFGIPKQVLIYDI